MYGQGGDGRVTDRFNAFLLFGAGNVLFLHLRMAFFITHSEEERSLEFREFAHYDDKNSYERRVRI